MNNWQKISCALCAQNCGLEGNRLTKNKHRDKLAGTPFYRRVPCRVEARQM